MSCYLIATGRCYSCRELFTFNPELVPSVYVDCTLHPICKQCVDRVNPEREANNLPPIIPLPGAYGPEEM